MPQVIEATLADIPELCALLDILFTQEADFSPDRAKQSEGLRLIISDRNAGRILTLRDGSEIVGMANLLFSISTARGGRVAILEDVVVKPERRGQGAGTQLLEAAIDCARRQACSRVTLLTDRDNMTAQGFYERHGFTHSAMTPMRLLLS